MVGYLTALVHKGTILLGTEVRGCKLSELGIMRDKQKSIHKTCTEEAPRQVICVLASQHSQLGDRLAIAACSTRFATSKQEQMLEGRVKETIPHLITFSCIAKLFLKNGSLVKGWLFDRRPNPETSLTSVVNSFSAAGTLTFQNQNVSYPVR